MFEVFWGVLATAFGVVIASDFRGAAHRFHAITQAATPFAGSRTPVLGVGFLRAVAGAFAVIGPIVLALGLLGLWRGEAGPVGPQGPPMAPAWIAVPLVLFVGVILWWTWRSSGPLRREWDTGTRVRRVAAVGLTLSVVAFLVLMAAGQGAWAVTSHLVGGLCGLLLLVSGDRVGR
ncbi:hypothetical protein [Streptomyces sp. CC208A]|uniref:hypothetical protein n=1 Tax=Streptomyces sp. CC208A TaxID=3044573 RepID=UPI0024A81000|nr:hypothetical protein [Streptomyces sp. CC208A]